MQRLATLAVVAALLSPTVASGQDYTFGDWARDQGYEPGDVMPEEVDAESSGIDSLYGVSHFDWTTAPTRRLWLLDNQLSSIESSAFRELMSLTSLYLGGNQLSGIEPGTFSGLTNLTVLSLVGNQLSSLDARDFSSLTNLTTLYLSGNHLSSVESRTFSELTNLRELGLSGNQLSSIGSDAFIGLANLENLNLSDNGIASIEATSFSGLPNLEAMYLYGNPVLTELELAEADCSSLKKFSVEGNLSITSVSLRNSVVNQMSLIALLDGGVDSFVGIGELDATITTMDLSGIDFIDITDLSPLHAMDDLTDLRLVDTQNLDAVALDVLLDNLEAMESPDVEGILYMTQADYNAFNAAGGGLLSDWNDEQGHHVEFVPEPSTLLICIIALAMAVGSWKQHVMQRLAALAVVIALMLPTVASGQDYSFGDWARDQGYEPGDVMPDRVWADLSSPAIDSLDGIGEFDWTATPTTWLDLSFNQLTSIEPDDFSGLTNLESLNLNRNQLTSIEPDDFSAVTNLTSLQLGDNQLTSIESGDFDGLTNLTRLYLRGNQISSIESGDFSGLTNLTSLRLGGNQLTSIESGDFNGLANLTSLGLGDNQLSSIESGDFSGLTNLTMLDLNYNQLSSIEADDFSGLMNLTELRLGGNQIPSIESGDFSGLTNLQRLELHGNQIPSIESGDFDGLTNLTTLWLQGNQLSSIESGAFSGLTNLESLNLSDNQLSSIESGAFSGLANLRSLNLAGNHVLTQLNLEAAGFSSLAYFDLGGNAITSVSLRNTVMNQTSLATLLDGGTCELCFLFAGIGNLDGITELDLSGIDFADITDLSIFYSCPSHFCFPGYGMDDLTDLWLVNTQNVDAIALDELLDNLETIESSDTEGILHMTRADYDAFNAAGGGLLADWNLEPGHHVEFVPEPSTNFLCVLALCLAAGLWKRHVMQRLAILAVVAARITPTVASGQDYTFGDWARDQGYEPGDVMPDEVYAQFSSIDSLMGIGEFDWTTAPTWYLVLLGNQLSSIESGDFNGTTNLTQLRLDENQITSIESGGFHGLTNLESLHLNDNQISSIESGDFSGLANLRNLVLGRNELSSIESGDFSGLTNLGELSLSGNQITSLESGAFSGLTNLWRLWLYDNQLSSIESGSFSGLANLRKLDLQSNQLSSIESGDFNGLTNLRSLWLHGNQLTSIKSGDVDGLTNLTHLYLDNNQISSIESGAFRGLTNLWRLSLRHNIALTELNLAEADFSSLASFEVAGNVNITSVSLRNAVVNQASLEVLVSGGGSEIGIGELDGITEIDLSGMQLAFMNLSPLYVMDDLTDLWLVDTQNVNATTLDVLLDNLETIESPDIEGVLYMTQADYDAFNAAGGDLLSDWNDEEGHHVEFLQIGDVNHDTEVNGLDVDPFVDVLLTSRFDVAADMNWDGAVNGLDVDPLVAAVVGGSAAAVPEPSTLLLCIIALAVVGGWQKWRG